MWSENNFRILNSIQILAFIGVIGVIILIGTDPIVKDLKNQ